VAEFNRFNRHKLVIEDAMLAELKFGGTFRPDRYETLIGLLEQSFDVVVDRRETVTVLRRRVGE
jgi:transmembrane sensor